MILSNLAVPLLGLVDTAVLGHLGAPYYLGAVAVGAIIFNFLFWGFGFLRMGTTGLTAQAHGGGDALEMRAHLARALALALVLGMFLVLFHGPIGRVAFGLIEASAEVRAYAAEYYAVRIYGAPAALAGYALLGWFLGMQNARAPLLLLLLGNGVNIALDLWFVLGLQWKVFGVALGSVIAEYLVVLAGLGLVWRELRKYPVADGRRPGRLWDTAALRRLWRVNRDIFIRTLCLIFVFAFFTAQGARFGDALLAANAVLLNFQTLMAYGLDGFAHAAEALVGRALGARDAEAFRRAVRTTGLWGLLVAIGASLIYAVLGDTLVGLLTDLPDVRRLALEFLPWMMLSPLVSVWSYLLDGIFIGATRTREMRDTMIVSTLAFLCCWYLLQPWGGHGLWLALLAFMAARGLSMAWVYRRLDARSAWTLRGL